MSNYPGRTKGTRRIVVWHKNQRHEKVIQGGKRDADEYEARWRLELRSDDQVDPKDVPTFSSFCLSRYRPHAVAHLKESTWNKVRKYQLATLEEHFGDVRLSEFSLVQVERYKAARAKATVKRGGKMHPIKATPINNELRVLKTVLTFAREMGYPVPRLKWKPLPVHGKPRAPAWSVDQINALYDATQEEAPELLPMFVFLVNTGCRKGEAMAAEWSWVDLAANLIRIPSNEVWQPKNGLPREVPISDALLAALTGPKKSPTWLHPARHGGRYVDFPKDLFARIKERAGVPGTPHWFRHTYASHFLAATKDLRLLADTMGHSLTRVTSMYTHLLPGHMDRARNAVNFAPTIRSVAGAVAGAEEL